MNRFLVLLILTCVLFSCEGNTSRTWHITNDSGSTFQVKAHSYTGESFEVLMPGQTRDILSIESIGGNSNPGTVNDYLDSLFVIAGLDTMKKDYAIESHWEITSEKTKKIPSSWEHDFWFVVEESDFQ